MSTAYEHRRVSPRQVPCSGQRQETIEIGTEEGNKNVFFLFLFLTLFTVNCINSWKTKRSTKKEDCEKKKIE